MKEILVYGSMYSWSASDFITELHAASAQDVVIRMNTSGGSVESAFGMIAKMQERKNAKVTTTIKVDGKAHSMGAFWLAYADDVEALNVSEILIHRAAYASYIENDPEYMTEDMRASLKRANDILRAALEAKINTTKLLQIKGVTMDQIFSTETRIDVLLTADEAKQIGLIDRVVQLTPVKRAEISSCYEKAANSGVAMEPMKHLKEAVTTTVIKNKVMTIQDLKTQHPDAVTALTNEILTAERDRTAAYLLFIGVDPEAVKEGIASGKPMTQAQTIELMRKEAAAGFLTAAETGSAGTVTTKPENPGTGRNKADTKTAEQLAEEKFWAEVEGKK